MMKINGKVCFIFMLMFFLFVSGNICAQQHTVRASIDNNEYKAGDIITVRIDVTENSGLFGLYFDLLYNEQALALKDITQSAYTKGYPSNGKIKYALAEKAASAYDHDFVVATFALDEKGQSTESLGTVMELYFTVKSASIGVNRFEFSNCGFISPEGDMIGGTWIDSEEFTLGQASSSEYIRIIDPYNYQVLEKGEEFVINEDDPFDYLANTSITCSQGTYTVRIYNQSLQGTGEINQLVTQGFLLDETIPLLFEYNNITAELRNASNELVATDSIIAYLSPDDKFVKIISPADHSLHITDMVEVTIKSTMDHVEVNDMEAEYSGDGIFKINLWLKQGFNSVKAIAWDSTAAERLVYKDEISVYYQKNDALFQFISPRNGQSFKPGDNSGFVIQGEIGSKYKSAGDYAGNSAVENKVTLDIYYEPANFLITPYYLAENMAAVISEIDIPDSGIERQSRYIFQTENISLAGLKNGKLIITAYKNKDENGSEAEISRIVYIDNNRLSINLIQPMVFSRDVLDSKFKINSFNLDPATFDQIPFANSFSNLGFDGNGSILLTSSGILLENQGYPDPEDTSVTIPLQSIVDVAEAPDGTLYLLQNAETPLHNGMVLYEKGPDDEDWRQIYKWWDTVGYDLCYTRMGLLIGATHLYSNDDPCMYILEDDTIYSMELPVDLLYIQFIECINNKVYFYGNDYIYLYSFDENTIRRSVTNPDSARTIAEKDLIRIPFTNNVSIKQFILTQDAQTAVLRTRSGEVQFYNRSDIGYVLEEEIESIFGTHIAGGSYSGSDFSAFVILNDIIPGIVQVVMKSNKNNKYTHLPVVISGADYFDGAIDYMWCNFSNDYFTFMYRRTPTGDYYIQKGQLFFNRFNLEMAEPINIISGTIGEYNHVLFTTLQGNAFINYGLTDTGLNLDKTFWGMSYQYNTAGDADFNYINRDIKGISGFAFDIHPLWITENSPIEIGFTVHSFTGKTDLPEGVKTTLDDFLTYEDDLFKVSHYFDSAIQQERVYVDFTPLREDVYISFSITINPAGNVSPGIHDFSVFKKIPVFVARNGDAELFLPIRGNVNDRTVKEIFIQGTAINLERDGSFYRKIPIISEDLDDDNSVPVILECSNSANEKAVLEFKVKVVDSFCHINEFNLDLIPSQTIITVTDEELTLVGRYFGLNGVNAGYELRRLAFEEEEERILERGVFQTRTYDNALIDNFISEYSYTITEKQDYSAFTFGQSDIETVTLFPGQQKLILFVENPNGFRKEIVRIINYDIPDDQQEIVINPSLETTIADTTEENTIILYAYEKETPGGFIFNRYYELTGYVKTNYITDSIKARSMTQGLLFPGEKTVSDFALELENRFVIPLNITMDETINKTFQMELTTGIPGVNELRKVVDIKVKNNYENTRYIPDLTPMIQPAVSLIDDTVDTIVIAFRMNRTDIPVPTIVSLTCNFTNTVTGKLIKQDPDDESLFPLYILEGVEGLPGLKPGNNRISWKCEFIDPTDAGGNTRVLMSSSRQGKPGMSDTLFVYNPDEAIETNIRFSEDLSTICYGNDGNGNTFSLPSLLVTKDESTVMTITFNGSTVDGGWVLSAQTQNLTYNFESSPLTRQGKNEILITYQEYPYSEDAVVEQYAFLYDSEAPVVTVEEKKLEVSANTVEEFSVFVKEANYAKVFLFQGDDIIERVPDDIKILDYENLRLTWRNIVLNPGTNVPYTLAAKVEDITGKQTMSDAVSNIENNNEPDNWETQKHNLTLPLFEEGHPAGIDDDFQDNIFSGHSKFAPFYLNNQPGIKTILSEHGNNLIRNIDRQQIIQPSTRDYDINFGQSIATNGDYLAVGAPYYNKTLNTQGEHLFDGYWGRVFIYQRQIDGSWEHTQTLSCNTEGWFEYGTSVAMVGNILVVSAMTYYDEADDPNDLLLYETYELDTEWTFRNSFYIHYNLGDRPEAYKKVENTSMSIDPYGNYLMIGEPNLNEGNGEFYIFKRNGTSWEKLYDEQPTGSTHRQLGFAVDIHGSHAVTRNPGGAGDIRLYKIDETASPPVTACDTWTFVDEDDIYNDSVSIYGNYVAYGHEAVNEEGEYCGQVTICFIDTHRLKDFQRILQPEINGEYVDTYFGKTVELHNGYLIVSSLNNYFFIFKKSIESGLFEFLRVVKEPDPDPVFDNGLFVHNSIIANWAENELIVSVHDKDQNFHTQGTVYSYKMNNFIDGTLTYFGYDYDTYKRQLLFKISKSNISNKNEIPNKVKLEVKSRKYQEDLIDIVHGDKELLDTSGYSAIIEADDYYYYVINAVPLRAAYLEAAESITSFDPFSIIPASIDQNDVYYDLTLNINSDVPLTDVLLTTSPANDDFSQTIVYNQNYSHPSTMELSYPDLNQNTQASGFDSPATENKTILMWLRSDEEGAGKNKPIYGAVEKTFFYYKDAADENDLLELRYKENNDNPDILLYNKGSLIATAEKSLRLGKNTWNLIALRFSPDSGIDLFINGVKTNSITNLPAAALNELVQGSELYYFGSEEYRNTGFYSIAEPCFANAALKDDDIKRIYTARLNEVAGLNASRNYYLNSSTTDFGPAPYELRANGGTDFYTTEQRAFYNSGGGSLKASSSQKNYLETITYPMFLGADNYDERNVSRVLTGTTLEISPTDPELPAKYFFGDKTGNYGLRKNRWYSVSGHVVDVETAGESKIVLRINGEEQSMILKEGDFHFIYNNEKLLTPEDVVLYFETTGRFSVDTNIIFNEGNYILKTDVQETCASTLYYWGYEGKIAFWYKPLNANNIGTVNYETVLFDSEYIKIGTKIPSGETEAYFYAQIKKGNTISKEFLSTIKVLNKWQRIHFTYDWDTNRCFTYFYIDDKLVDSIEQSSSWNIPNAGTITGAVTDLDNVYFGSNLARTQFAEGYIDHVYISNLFNTPDFQPNHPVRIAFNPETEEITLSYDPAASDHADTISYILETVNGVNTGKVTPFSDTQPIDVSDLSGGRYRLKTEFVNWGHHYNDYLLFNIDKEPAFALVKQTPFIVRDLPFNIDLQFLFDPYQHFEKDDIVYPGIAVGLYRGDTTSNPVMCQYIVGDFLTQKPETWIRGTRYGTTADIEWEDYSPDNAGYLCARFMEYIVENEDMTNKLTLVYKPFYTSDEQLNASTDPFDFDDLGSGLLTTIPVAQLHAEKVKHGTTNTLQGYEYKLDVAVEPEDPAAGTIDFSSLDEDLLVNYHATLITDDDDETGAIERQGSVKLQNGQISLFYDDMLPQFGTYNCVVSLEYKGRTLDSCIFQNQNTLKWTGTNEEIIVDTESHETIQLEMADLSLCYMDTEDNSAELRYTFDYYIPDNGTMTNDILISAYILNNNSARKLSAPSEYDPGFIYVSLPLGTYSDFITIYNIPKGDSTIRLTFTKEDVVRSMEIDIRNDEKIPEVIFTNRVDRHISHNNIYLSWRGEVENKFNDNIEFSYNFNGQGWTTPDEKVRDLRLFDLAEGDYTFAVKAYYNDCESPPYSLPFTVDTERPIFDITKIEKIFTYDPSGIPIMVKLKGDKAVVDIDLQALSVNNTRIDFTREGSFETGDILLTKDGDNEILLTAYDRVNFTDCTIVIENPLTKILYPNLKNSVRYSPFVLVGQILETVPSLMTIYVSDPMTKNKGPNDYSNWKKAVINEDRTFFVEDIFINPGTRDMELTTVLNMVCVLESGYTFERELRLDANEIIMPIELTFSTHAVEGQNADTEITIDCHANVPNISSWSCDFDGDGIYDVIDLVDNPASVYSKDHSWKHAYSTIGLIKPRVRVVTTDGVFFSVTDTLTIHEKIKDASPTLVNNPISLSAITSRFNTQRLFVLRKEDQIHYLDIYTIPQFDPWPFKSEDSINLSVMNMEKPVRVRAIDENTLIVADNRRDHAVIYQLTANEFGNYDNEMRIMMTVPGEVRDISLDNKTLYISFIEEAYITKVPIRDNKIIPSEKEDIVPNVPNALPVGINPGIEADDMGLLIADYENSRVLRLSEKYRALEKYASIGTGEKEFIEPSHIISHQNRIFVFDNRRKDIQVFDSGFGLVTTLRYNLDPNYANYVSDTFFNDVADIEVIAREENKRIYYYAFILSRSDNKLAVLRLPQWEEFRVRVRNNKLVFIKNGEVYTSKPTGADLKKVLSSDSIPRIEGSLDYPALSPDGTSLVFTSRYYLYHGDPDVPEEQPYGYDYLYLYDIESGTLRILDLGYLAGHSIERPTFSSNGDRIIFSAKGRDKNWQIYIYTIKTGDIRELDVTVGDTPENARFPYFSPDDRYVVFTTDYDGDEDIEIYDTKTTMRMVVTDNNARDSYPVWNAVFPDEIETSDWDIESKIAFVSDRDFHKAVYNIYLSRPNPDNLLLFNIYTGETGGNPDDTAIEISKEYISATESEIIEGDYPCFTGDGTQLFLETSDGYTQQAKKFDFTNEQNHDNIKLEDHDGFIFEDINILKNIRRMAGMKNTVTNFTAENVDGNCIQLKWDRYTTNDIFYYVEFRHSSQSEPDYKKVSTQDSALLQGLRMNDEYTVRVFVKELGEIVTASQWRTVKMPVVAARPTITIDEENPYLARLHAWKADEDDRWGFSWKIDNTLFPAGESQDYDYEFGTSGTKSISLIATDLAGEHDEISRPVMVEIKSDIRPVIEYVLAEDSSAIELSAESSKGRKINWSETRWVITGSGNQQEIVRQGPVANVDLTGFSNKINVTLYISRIPVNDQQTTDVLIKTTTIDLDLKDVRPIITEEPDKDNPRLIYFSGENSIGNIDWTGAQWTVYRDGAVIDQRNSVSSFAREFSQTNIETIYSITLTVPCRNSHMTETTSKIISVSPTPIEPVIEHQILRLTEDGNTVTAKLLLDCTKSTGNNIDFTKAQWNIAGVGAYGEDPTQYGPTAIYTMSNIGSDAILPVVLTLSRRDGDNPVSVTKFISISSEDLGDAELFINKTIEKATDGNILILDVLNSTGPNINWEATTWTVTIPGQTQYETQQIQGKGPVIQIDVEATAENMEIAYTCTLYRHGGKPETVTGSVDIQAQKIYPVISTFKISGSYDNYFELSVLESEGMNIDWDKTTWYIYDGHESVVILKGATISHAFIQKEKAMGYPVLVEMFFNGSSIPFTGYETISIEGDEMNPIVRYDRAPDNPNTFIFNASSSKGNNLKWTNTTWTFGDSTQPGYGAVVSHTFPVSSQKTTYRISCTIMRVGSNGQEETKTIYKEIDIKEDKIRPVVKAQVMDGTLILSAEESEGRGLLLDRSVWLFPGEGDSTSYSGQTIEGTVERESSGSSQNINASYQFGTSNEYVVSLGTIGGGLGWSQGSDSTGYSDDYRVNNDSFSSQNAHIGVICRRSIDDANQTTQMVTLMVYRMTDEGTQAESITVNINLDKARSGATFR
ncbi:MAG: PD40 domain-containing protein [Spirochaetales bacterium]|nr:PD40 domain-containing protein [Spirochaetales bacterium]